MNPESPEIKCTEFNANSNSNLVTVDETCVAQRKLENMFNKHMQKRRLQFSKPVVHVDTYVVIDNLLNQHGNDFCPERLSLNIFYYLQVRSCSYPRMKFSMI